MKHNARKQAKKKLRVALPPGVKWGAWKECCELLKEEQERLILHNEYVLENGKEASWRRRNLDTVQKRLKQTPPEVLQQAKALLQQVEML
jgi:hypothetical protein